MLPKNPLPQLSLPRIQALLPRVQRRIWQTLPASIAVEASAPQDRPTVFATAAELPLTPAAAGHRTGGCFTYTWYRLRLDAPARAVWLRWCHEGESTAYVGGEPWAGFDKNHLEHRIPDGTTELWMHVMCGVPERTLSTVALLKRDEATWQAACDLEVLLEAAICETRQMAQRDGRELPFAFTYRPMIERATSAYRRLLRRFEDAADAYDRGSLAALQPVLDQIRAEFPADPQRLKIAATGHSHLDLVWLWPEHAAEFKAVHTFSTMLRLMDQYPEFRFAYSQPASYEAVARQAPHLFEEVRARIGEGRWEAEGALYVESDVLLPCGEGLVRGFLLGQAGFEQLTGKPSRILWLPDVFGYGGCLPQVMKLCGVDFFYTSKMEWNPVTPFPFSSFRWVGDDGSEVLAHLSLHSGGFNLEARPREMRDIESVYRQGDVHGESLAPCGFGDGGGGATFGHCERIRRMNDFYFVPPTRWRPLGVFFDGLESVRENLPVYNGELYLEYHRGTATNQSAVKRIFRRVERELQTLEAVHAVRHLGPIDEQLWKRAVFAQFHDFIPGSSINEVYRLAVPELERLADRIAAAAVERLTAPGGEACLFNPIPQPREEIVVIAGVPTAVVVPALAGVPVKSARRAAAQHPVAATVDALDNGRVRVTFDDRGQVEAFSVDGVFVRLDGPANRLAVYPENPTMFDAWDIDRQSLANGAWIESPATATVEESHPLRGIVSFTRDLGMGGRLVTHYRLDAGDATLRITYEIDWREPRTLLKAHFPTGYRATQARFGAPFGSVLRAQRAGLPDAEAKWESHASRWAAVFDEGEQDGLFVVTEDKYGFGCRDGDLNVSLLRSPETPDGNRGTQEVAPGEPLPENLWDRPYTDLGHHTIRIAIGHYDTRRSGATLPAALADRLFTPLVAYCGTALEPLPTPGMEGSLLPAWCVPGSDGSYTLRCHETLGRCGTASFAEAGQPVAHRRVDLRGRSLRTEGQDTGVDYGTYEIVSLEIRREGHEVIQ